MNYYGFETASGRCLFSASGAPEPVSGITVIGDERDLDIMKIQMQGEGDLATIAEKLPTLAEQVAVLEGERQVKLQMASQQISILTDAAELGGDANAKALADKWRDYRVKVYQLDLSDPTSVVWPEGVVV